MRWQHLVPVLFITACGRSSADSGVATSLTPSTTDPQSARYFATNTDLPSCDASTDHWLVFVASIKTFTSGGNTELVDLGRDSLTDYRPAA